MVDTFMKTSKITNEMTLEDKYKQMSDHEHILTLPDTYIGSIVEDIMKMWVYDPEKNQMVFSQIKYVPGLYKIFDEILVNSRDQTVRDKTCNEIRATINIETGEITIWNNGDNGIEVEFHKEAGCYVPEMIFGMLRTSANYSQVGKIVGGKNGLGAKLCVLFSSYFIVEIVDAKRMLSYKQTFSDNMYKKTEPIIEKLKGKQKSYTKITFKPDYKRFGVEGLTVDMYNLFQKRLYDISAITPNVKVYLNDKEIAVKNFENYINMFYADGETPSKPVFKVINDRWQVGMVYDPNSGHRQISYVNGICTYQGGTHVTYVMDQVVGPIHDMICAKNKNLKIKHTIIKENLTTFVNAIIEDPSFSSQTKEQLTTKSSNFGSTCNIDSNFIKLVSNTGLYDEVVNFARFKAEEGLKKTDGKKVQKLKGVDKLTDAQWAGTRRSKECTLILTEGDSAAAYALAGIEVVGRERFGVFPLRGKLLNVRDKSPDQLAKNEEIKAIKQIMGLKQGKKYTDLSQLRYGSILVLTDQDHDGSHIKGLVINFIHFFWPELLKLEIFIGYNTPIVKVWKTSDVKKKNVITFTSLNEYQKWAENVGASIKYYTIKYYKGLGTSTETEAKESFKDYQNKVLKYIWEKHQDDNDSNIIKQEKETINEEFDSTVSKTEDSDDDDDDDDDIIIDKTSESYDAITLAFAKTRANDRKKWLQNYDRNSEIDSNTREITFSDFVHKSLIHFSNYDNIRSIPSICDGLKPSQRKILYGCMAKKIYKNEIKVAQLSGYIAEVTVYHHGEVSLQGAIVAMAQNFVGSNNVNILTPNGNFGTRRLGGKNAASARYIFTQLSPLVPLIFRTEDECIYTYVNDDGIFVEPETYLPVVCYLLVNGCQGIGTGFSTYVPSYYLIDIINNQRRIINGEEPVHMLPYFRGFKGKVIQIDDNTFETHGIYEIINENTIEITELPPGLWTNDYKSFIDSIVADDIKNPQKGEILKEVVDNGGNNTVKFIITFLDGVLQELIKKNEIPKKLGLIKRHNMSNKHVYNTEDKIVKYNDVNDILKEYCKNRLNGYVKRKIHNIKELENKVLNIGWKIKFINDVINHKIIIFENNKSKTKNQVMTQLVEFGYPKLSNNVNAEEHEKSYDYLLDIKLFSITEDEKEKLYEHYMNIMSELDDYKKKTEEQIWLEELDVLEQAYLKWEKDQLEIDMDDIGDNKKTKGKGKKTVKKLNKK